MPPDPDILGSGEPAGLAYAMGSLSLELIVLELISGKGKNSEAVSLSDHFSLSNWPQSQTRE